MLLVLKWSSSVIVNYDMVVGWQIQFDADYFAGG